MQTSGSGSHVTISSHLLCSSNHAASISTLMPLQVVVRALYRHLDLVHMSPFLLTCFVLQPRSLNKYLHASTGNCCSNLSPFLLTCFVLQPRSLDKYLHASTGNCCSNLSMNKNVYV